MSCSWRSLHGDKVQWQGDGTRNAARQERKSRLGAVVIGPAATVAEALRLVAASGALDSAVLDINLRGEMVFPVADALATRGVPFAFATGYDRDTIPERFSHVKRCEKPVKPDQVAKALFG